MSRFQTRAFFPLFTGVCMTHIFAGCAESKPRIEAVSPRVTGIDWRGAELAFDVTVKNPLPIGLAAAGGRYAIDIGKTELVSSENVPPIAVPSRATGVFTLPARFEFSDLLALSGGVGDAAEIPYRLRGALAFDAAGVPLELPFAHAGEIPILRMPTIEITGIEPGSVGLAGVSVTVLAEVENPNAFALGLGDLGFDLTVAGTRVGSVSAVGLDKVKSKSSGRVELRAQVSGADAITSVLTSRDIGAVAVSLRGSLETPFGKVPLARE